VVQAIQRTLTFDEFLDWYPEDGKRYELMGGEVVEMRPVGDHEEISSLITRKLDREIERLNLPYFIPKTCCIRLESGVDGYTPDIIVLDRPQLGAEPLRKKASTIAQGKSVRLVVEIASTNWQDDYAKKLEDYESLGIPEYWIVDYRALGGRRYIGFLKQPTVSVYSLQKGQYQVQHVRSGQAISSLVFPELMVQAEEILTAVG
jgi:Uma2 family endonuclease